jgi:hypothetical protein
MWVRMTYLTIYTTNIEAARVFYNEEDISGVIRRQAGYRFNYLRSSP